MQEHELISLELAVAQALELGRRRPLADLRLRAGPRPLAPVIGARARGLLDEGTDDVGLAARLQLLAQLLVGAASPTLADHHARVDRLSSRRQLAQGARVEVSVA